MSGMSRRSFLHTGTMTGTVMTAAGVVPRVSYAADDNPDVRYRELGSTGFKVSEVGFGAMNMRDPELVHAAIDAGINYVDTAHKYMNGVNEEVVGQVMSTKRDKVFLTTKLAEDRIPEFPEMITTSLKRLQTDHVDLLLAHSLDTVEFVRNEDIMKQLDDARRRGQTRFVGYSVHNQFPNEFLEATLDIGFYEAILVSYNYQSQPEVARNIERARKAGLAIIAMKTQMNGRGNPSAATDTTTPNQAALKWVLENDYVDTTVPGMTSFEHIAEDVAVMGMKLTSSERRDLRRFAEASKGNYCSGVVGCTGCKDKCPNGVATHEINRCLGYAYGYGDLRLARENYDSLPSSSKVDVCGDCDECSVTCINGLNMTDQIRRARSIFS